MSIPLGDRRSDVSGSPTAVYFVMPLRRNLEEDARRPQLLETVRGVGHRLAAQ